MLYDRTRFTALLIAWQTLVLLSLGASYWEPRCPLRYRAIVFPALSLIVGLCVYALCRLVSDAHLSYSFFYTLVLQLALCALLFRGRFRYQALYVVFSNVLYSISLLLSLMISVLLLPRFGTVIGISRISLVMNLLFQVLAFVLVFALRKQGDPRRVAILPPAPYWICIFALYALIYVGSVYVSDTLIGGRMVTLMTPVIETALLAVCVVVYLLFLRACEGYSDKLQRTLMEKQLSLQHAHLEELRSAGEAMRTLRHELKNYMFYMQYLIDKKDFDALTHYFRDFYEREYHNLVEVDSSGGILSAVLHQKLSTAGQHGIRITDEILCAVPPEIDEQDLCILLSNLLDNAIEGSIGVENAVILVRMKRVKEYLSLVVSNTVGRDVLKENPQLNTSKQQREIHGIGLKVIRELVRKYDGSVTFESGNGMFHAKLMLRAGGDRL